MHVMALFYFLIDFLYYSLMVIAIFTMKINLIIMIVIIMIISLAN